MPKHYFIFIVILFFLIGCESTSTPGLTNSELARVAQTQNIEVVESEGVPVVMVGDQKISCDDIIRTQMDIGGLYISPLDFFKTIAASVDLDVFKEQARFTVKQIITERISSTLLYLHAKREAGETLLEYIDKAAESELRKFDLQFGGNQAQADDILSQNYLDRNSYLERQKKAIVIQWYIDSKTTATEPTYRELKEQYDKMKEEYFSVEGTIQFRLIDIQPARVQITEPNQDSQKLAEEMAISLLSRIKAGEDFGQLAKEYSHGPMKDLGGLWKPLKPESLAGPYRLLVEASEIMSTGDISDVIIAPEHFFIMKCENKQIAGYIPFEQVQDQVRQEILFGRRNDILDKLNTRIQPQAEMAETGRFVEFCLEELHRLSKQED